MNRVLIYALNHPVQRGGEAVIPHYVEQQLQLLAPFYDRIITSPHSSGEWEQWRAGIKQIKWSELNGSSLTLMSSSAFGPTDSLAELLTRMEADGPDYWTLSNTGAPFFFHFSPKVVSSGAFHAFFDAKPPTGADATTLRQHLFRALTTAGFQGGTAVAIDPKAVAMGPTDPGGPRPDLWAEADVPFLLIEDLIARPDFTPYALDYLEAGGYPAATASAQLSQLTAPDEKALLWAKQRNYRNSAPAADNVQGVTPSVAIHVHAHYPEMLSEFFQVFEKYEFPFTLFITTAEAKLETAHAALADHNFKAEVIPVPNLGRDIYPMFLLKDRLAEFEVIAHFHTKKSNHERAFVADSWLRELMSNVVIPGNAIVSDFANRPELGVVISDVPSFFRANRIVYPEGEAPLLPLADNLWERMNFHQAAPFKPHSTFIMSYGTFFWARYDAIKPLLELNIADELPVEPVPENHTILHALERMWVYVAWAQGYDFAISEGRYLTVFADAAAPTLEGVSFKRLVQQKISHRLPVTLRRKIVNATGWKPKD